MRLSEQLRRDSNSGNFGKALEGYAERAAALENLVEAIAMIEYYAYRETCLSHELIETAREILSNHESNES